MSTALRSGTVLGPYRIVAPLGAGGMGEVFRAHDTKLDRPVALKILPAEVTRDAERLRRFVQEAKSASSLSHPNIVVVHDIGSAMPADESGATEPGAVPVHYIAMELVEGATLRQLFADRSIEPRTLLAHLAQAAEGLAKAHAAGIVHRDLKPENIMVTRDGYAKVLDFGLAKLTEASVSGSALAAAPTALAEEHTREGAVVGTIGYMSPEQAQGKPVDHRTDLFSFGCLLYEAATGKRPFTGESHVDVLHAIVRETPEPVEKLSPTVPRALVRRIRRCLEKDPNKRAQSMKDLAFELHDLVEDWDTLATPSGTVTTGASLSGAAAPVRAGRGRAGGIAIAAGALAVAAAAAWIWTSRAPSPGAAAERGFRSMRIAPLTSTGDVYLAALSPDGRYLAHVRGGESGDSLWVRQIATGSDVEIVAAAGADRGLANVRFTPDGDYVSYTTSTRRPEVGNQNDLFLVPTLGGTPRLVLGDIDSPAAWSPDGRRFAFVRRDVVAGETRFLTAAADGGDEQVLTTRRSADGHEFATTGDGLGPVWSPDGDTLAVPGWTKGRPDIAVVSARDGSVRVLDELTFVWLDGLAWMPDGGSFVASARLDATARNNQLVRIAAADGRLARITNDLSDYGGVSLDTAGTHLVSTQITTSSELWTAAAGGGTGSRLLGSGGRETYGGPEAAADGTLVYVLERGTESAIWKKPPGGAPPVRLTHRGAPSASPWISTDGRRVAFLSVADDGTRQLFTMNGDGGDLRQITTGTSIFFFSVAPDGSWLVYMSPDRGFVRQSVADGAEQKLEIAQSTPWQPMISPGGDRLAYMASISLPGGKTENVAVVIPAAGGQPLAIVPRPSSSEARDWRWHPDGRSLLYARIEGKGENIWRLPLDGSAPTRLTEFQSTPIFGFTMTADGKTIVYAKGSVSSDAVMIENFQ